MHRIVFAVLLLGLPALAAAQDVPEPLEGWQAWVLHDHRQQGCPFLTGLMPAAHTRRCLWPGELAITADADGGRFQVAVRVDGEAWLPLPGGNEHWPQQVTDDGDAVVVADHDGRPMVHLQPGDHQLAGRWLWNDMPARLALPQAYGLVNLMVAGQPVADVQRAGGAVSLGDQGRSEPQPDALSLKVYRRLQDGLPPTLSTRIELDVSGSARELELGPVLPPGFVATQLQAGIPARLGAQGQLHLQVRAGRWQVTLGARGTEVLGKLAPTLPSPPWPEHETWSYADHPELRRTGVEGVAVDAAQAGVPGAWRNLPAFRIDNAHGLQVEVGARAGQGGAGDRLSVQRVLWLDFDGDGFTARDKVRGHIEHPRPLQAAPPWVLQRAGSGGRPLLIGVDDAGVRSVELRDGDVQLDASLYLADSGWGALPISAWRIPLQALDVHLRLPSGYRLLGAPGAGRSPDSWVAGWTLLDLFLVALIALLCGRLLGWPMAALALAYLALSHDESFAPYLSLLLLAGLALLARALPQGRLRRVTRWVACFFLVLAVLWTLPYSATQLRYALYPQLAHHGGHVSAAQLFPAWMGGTAGPRAARVDAQGIAEDRVRVSATLKPQAGAEPESRRATAVSADAAKASVAFVAPPPPAPVAPPPRQLAAVSVATMPQADLALVQSGPGMPDWDLGNNYRLHWSGPVLPGQQAHLIIAPSWLLRLLRVVAVACLWWLLLRLALSLQLRPLARWRPLASAAAVLLAVMAAAPGAAQAEEIPSQQLLAQLQKRLLEPPPCAPQCALLPSARVALDGDSLRVFLKLQAGATVAVPMPQAGEGMSLESVSLDGQPAALLGSDGGPWLRIERGVHGARLSWHLANDEARLTFQRLQPKRLQVDAPGWRVSGIDQARLRGDTLRFVRTRQAASGEPGQAAGAAQAFAPYVRLTRHLLIGSDWHLLNTVQRLAPASAGFSVRLPLLPGEHPLAEDAKVEDGRISVSFKAGQGVAYWRSRVEPFSDLSLTAPPLAKRSERWQISASPAWHVQAEGVPPQPVGNLWQFAPLPGEVLDLAITHLDAAPGASVAVDSARLDTRPGDRASEVRLTLELRTTHGGSQVIKVPAEAKLLSAERDGQRLPLAVHQGQLSLPLRPGRHSYLLDLRLPAGTGLVARTPAVDLQAPVANIDLRMNLSDDRWLLWTWGPQNGPAVLYWSQLLVLLLVAWLLARFAPTPLRLWHWILLGLGFSTFAWSAFALVAVWLIVLGLRDRLDDPGAWSRLGFNLVQIGLALLTMLALLVLIGAIPRGLLGQPDMHLAGSGYDTSKLHWMLDKSDGVLPRAGALSLPLWCYKIAILAWALWLANALIGWLRWAWRAWSRGGYWRRKASAAEAPPASE